MNTLMSSELVGKNSTFYNAKSMFGHLYIFAQATTTTSSLFEGS